MEAVIAEIVSVIDIGFIIHTSDVMGFTHGKLQYIFESFLI